MPIFAAGQVRKREPRGLALALTLVLLGLLILVPVTLLALATVQRVEMQAGRFHFRLSYEDDRHTRRDWVVQQGVSYYPPGGPDAPHAWDLHLSHSLWTFRIETW